MIPPSPLPWTQPTVLAPLQGVGHPVFRALVAEAGGIGLICADFLRVGQGPLHRRTVRRHIVRVPGVPLSVQLLGQHPQRLADAAALLSEHGADVVDINAGCPVRRIVSKGAGAALLRDPDGLHRLLSHVRAAVAGPLSVKIRTGFEDSQRLDELGDAIQAAGVDFVTVHPRSREQQYRDVADWRLISHLKSRLRIPVVGNGDCWYAVDVQRMRQETGCDAVMLGRPALRNPWIFSQAADLRAGRTPCTPNGAQVVGFLERAAAAYGERFGEQPWLVTGRLKELISYLGRALPREHPFLHAALRASDASEILRLADSSVRPLPSESLDLDAYGRLGFEQSGSV
ncbi:MAG: tRNA-dihydrouridine synthase family protein [bacterium]